MKFKLGMRFVSESNVITAYSAGAADALKDFHGGSVKVVETDLGFDGVPIVSPNGDVLVH